MITTGSGAERFLQCRASSVLPRVWSASTAGATRGQETHGHLERVSNGMAPADSLDAVDPKYRGAVEAVDLDALGGDLALAAEVALAYSPETDTARVIGQSLERDYSTVRDDEIPMTLDIVGVRHAESLGIVRDWKSGWQRLAPTKRNAQMFGGSLAVARAFDVDVVDAQLVYLRDGTSIRRDRHRFEPAELAVVAAEIAQAWTRALADRERFAHGEHIEPTEGSWCSYCPSRWHCPAKIALMRAVVDPDGLEIPKGTASPVVAAEALVRIQRAKKLLKDAETAIYAAAAEEPLLLEVQPDGTEVWLGKHVAVGNEKLDPNVSIDAAAEVLLGEDRAAGLADLMVELAEFKVTKQRLDAAIKSRVDRGKGAKTMDRILGLVRARGGATRPTTEKVEIYTVRKELAGAAS